MAALSPLFTDAQLEIAVGGAPSLVRLARASGPSDPVYAAFKAEVRMAAQADAYGLAKIAVDPTDPTVSGAGLMQQLCVTCGVYWAHSKGSGGQEIPPEVTLARKDAIEALKELRDGSRTLDTGTDPTSNLGAPSVKIRAPGAVIRRNFRSFC